MDSPFLQRDNNIVFCGDNGGASAGVHDISLRIQNNEEGNTSNAKLVREGFLHLIRIERESFPTIQWTYQEVDEMIARDLLTRAFRQNIP